MIFLSSRVRNSPFEMPRTENKEEVFRTHGIIFVSGHGKDLSLLLVKGKLYEGKAYWSFPKGSKDSNRETNAQCAMREMKEETGIVLSTVSKCSVIKRLGLRRSIYYVKHVNKQDYLTFNIRDKKEIEEVAWKTMEECEQLIKNTDLTWIINQSSKHGYVRRVIYEGY